MTTVDIPALKRRYPLGDVVEASGLTLRGRGRVRQGVCPFHEETEGSFTVYADTQRWYCFGCGLGGDVLDFIQRAERVGLSEAIRRLDARPRIECGSGSSHRRGRGDRNPPAVAAPATETPPAQPPSVRDPTLLTAAIRFYSLQLRRSAEAQRYLASRGVDPKAAQRLGLGFAPGNGLREHLRALGFGEERLDASGLFSERGERFREMIVVPELDSGRVRWLAGRAVRPDAKPRFQALPGAKPVLGLRRVTSPSPWIVVAEGLFDWLLLASWGLPACSALGTQGMDKVASSLQGQARVLLAFDADEAGSEAARRLSDLLGPRRARIVTLPEGVGDVAELGARADGRAVFLDSLQRAARAGR